MPSSALGPAPHELSLELASLAWEQWSLLGLSAAPPLEPSRTALDPEALLLLTFEVGRDEPRLFDEALDWMAMNAELVSTNRLRGLCVDALDDQMANAALDWLGRRGRGARRARPRTAAPSTAVPTTVFPLDPAPPKLDADYLSHGLARRPVEPSGKSVAPDLLAPANLTLRLRTLLGPGPRAEVVRALLTIQAPRISGTVLTADAGYSSRRTREALVDLVAAGAVSETRLGGAAAYAIDRQAWSQLLWDGGPPPLHRDWPQLFAACRLLVRGLRELDSQPSAYLQASAARELWTSVEPKLRYAGVAIPGQPFTAGEDYLAAFDELVDAVRQHVAGLRGTHHHSHTG